MVEPKESIGPWARHDVLGRGGNATVWRATRTEDDEQVALKVIDSRMVDEESYVRFVREVEFHNSIGTVTGVLPLIDAHLPEHPSKSDRAWLAMPIANPIAEYLAERSLIEVVEAIGVISDTLVRLQRDYQVAHRDIKPGNLYELRNEFLIGDFGLIAVPNADSLTRDGRQVGPAHFTAYEMITHPSTADPHSADVYSFGKTLWVLATGQKYPPEGHQPADSRKFEIGDFRPHPRSAVLDQLVDRTTKLLPEERPTKEQVAIDLTAWKELSIIPPVIDMSAARQRLRLKIEPAMDKQARQQEFKSSAHEAARRLQEMTRPINKELKSLHPRTQIDVMDDKRTQNLLTAGGHRRNIIWDWRRCTLVSAFDGPMATTLWMSRALELFEDGTLQLFLMVHVGPAQTMGTHFDWSLRKPASAPAGSIKFEQILDEGVGDLVDAVAKAVEVFVDQLPDLKNPN